MAPVVKTAMVLSDGQAAGELVLFRSAPLPNDQAYFDAVAELTTVLLELDREVVDLARDIELP